MLSQEKISGPDTLLKLYVATEQEAGGMIMPEKKASTNYPVHELLAARWSPYAFHDRPVPEADLRSRFAAARWAVASYNEQPWSYMVATKENPEPFQQLLSCLVEANQGWAKAAPVLALGSVGRRVARNNTDTRAAVHDLGLAAGKLSQFVFSGNWGNPLPLVLKR
jgi:nitroreductase